MYLIHGSCAEGLHFGALVYVAMFVCSYCCNTYEIKSDQFVFQPFHWNVHSNLLRILSVVFCILVGTDCRIVHPLDQN